MPFLARLLAAPALALGITLTLPMLATAGTLIDTSVIADEIPKGKQTTPALYISAAEAAKVLNTREDVLLIDVRTPEETMLVGYPTLADVNIPFALLKPGYLFNSKKGSYEMGPNPQFVDAVQTYLNENQISTILVMCRSGGRSAQAVNVLSKAGIDLPLYSVVDGFEGDKDKSGQRTVNGWKNAGAPWTTKITKDFLHGVDE